MTRREIFALTLAQPIASAMVHGGKRIENRGWRPKAVELPAAIAIHAGARWWNVGTKTASKLDLATEEFCRARWIGDWPKKFPRRAIVGMMRVTHCVRLHDKNGTTLNQVDDPWAIGPWCWMIDRVWAFKEPVPCRRGALGLWPLPQDIQDLVWLRMHEDFTPMHLPLEVL